MNRTLLRLIGYGIGFTISVGISYLMANHLDYESGKWSWNKVDYSKFKDWNLDDF